MPENRRTFYEFIPRYYRYLDTIQGEPLRALAQIIQSQLNDVEANIEQLYNDWYIQTCQPWVVPYIGAMLGLKLNDQTYFLPNQRAWVANTIRYRRRKGNVFAMQPEIWDATDWYARAVQRFPTLVQTQSMQALKPTWGRSIDISALTIRDWLGSPFDTSAHRPGFASPFPVNASYNIPNVAIYVWRLLNYLVQLVPPRPLSDITDNGAKNRYHFNPLGFDIPLFDFPEGTIPSRKATAAKNLPAAIEPLAFANDLAAFRLEHQTTALAQRPLNTTYYGPERALVITELVRDELTQETVRVSINPMAIYPMPMPDWERPPADQWLSFTMTGEFPDDLPEHPAVNVRMGSYGPFLTKFPSRPESWAATPVVLQSAIQDAQVLDPILTGLDVQALGERLLWVSGLSASEMRFFATAEDPLILEKLRLQPEDMRTAFRSGTYLLPVSLTSTSPTMKIRAAGYPSVLAEFETRTFENVTTLAATLQTAIRTATPENYSILATEVYAVAGHLKVFSGTADFPQFYQGLDDPETVAELGLEGGQGSLVDQMNDPNLGLSFEKVILSGELLPGTIEITEGSSFYFSLNNEAALVLLPAMTIDSPESLGDAAAAIQTAIRDTPYLQTYPYGAVVVEPFRDAFLLVKAPNPLDQINIYPSDSDAAILLQLLEGERGVLTSRKLGQSINLSQPEPHMELEFLNGPVVDIQLEATSKPVALTVMAERLQTAIRQAAIIEPLYQQTMVEPLGEYAVVIIPGQPGTRFTFEPTTGDPWTVPQLKLDDAVDYRRRVSISGTLPPESFPLTMAPMADVMVTINPFYPYDAIINPSDQYRDFYDIRETAGNLQSAIQGSDDPAYRATTVEVWTDQMVTFSGSPFGDLSYTPGVYAPGTIDTLKLQDPNYILVSHGLRSGNLGELPLQGLPSQPQAAVTQGGQGPYLVDLTGIGEATTAEALAAILQTQIRLANPGLKYVSVIGRAYKSNNQPVTELLTAGMENLFFQGTPQDPETVEILQLNPGGRQAGLSGALVPFPIFSAKPIVLGVLAGEVPFKAISRAVPRTPTQTAASLQEAIRNAHVDLRAFNDCSVFNLPDPAETDPSPNPYLYIQPGARGMRTSITAAPHDSITYKALFLNRLITSEAACSGTLSPFPSLVQGTTMTITIGTKTGDLDPPTGTIYLDVDLDTLDQAAAWLQEKIQQFAIPGQPEARVWQETRVLAKNGTLLVLPGPWQPDPNFQDVQYGPVRFTTTSNDAGTLSYAMLLNNMVAIDVARGRMGFTITQTPEQPMVTYNYGFSGAIGSGPFFKPSGHRDTLSTYNVGANDTYRNLTDAIAAWKADGRPQARIVFQDSRLYRITEFFLDLKDRDFLIIEAAGYQNPVLIANAPLQIQTGDGSAELNWYAVTIQGQMIYSGIGRLTTNFNYCTLLSLPKDEAGFTGDENLPVMTAASESVSVALTMDLCISGPLRLPTYGLTLTISNAILDPYACRFPMSIAIAGLNQTPGPETIIANATVFGSASFYILNQASNVIFNQPITTLNTQTGIARYSYVPPGSVTPLRYRCQPDMALAEGEAFLPKPIYTSTLYPQPGFAQLAVTCDAKIAKGGANGGEMGAFCDLRQPNRQMILDQVLAANLPLGRIPSVFIKT